MSHWRSEFLRINRDDIDDRGLLQDAEQSKRHPWERIIHWKRLPDDRLVPYCLAWRLDLGGLQPVTEVPVSVLSKKRWPEQLLEDLTRLGISEEECRSLSSDSARVLESNLQAMKSLRYLTLTKRTEAGPGNSVLVEENATAGFVEYALQRIGSLDRLKDLHIEEQCLTLDHLHTILSLPKLQSLELESVSFSMKVRSPQTTSTIFLVLKSLLLSFLTLKTCNNYCVRVRVFLDCGWTMNS